MANTRSACSASLFILLFLVGSCLCSPFLPSLSRRQDDNVVADSIVAPATDGNLLTTGGDPSNPAAVGFQATPIQSDSVDPAGTPDPAPSLAAEEGVTAATGLNLTQKVPAPASNSPDEVAFAKAVCGDTASNGVVASESRTSQLWVDHKMDEWFANALGPYLSNGWKAPDGTQKKTIQSIILYLMGADGSDQCDSIENPNCSGQGLNYDKCLAYPEAHFLWFATVHWANFLNKLFETLIKSDLSLAVHEMVNQFFAPQEDPQHLLVPLSIAAGILTWISVAFPPASVATGAITVAQGIVIQAGLDRADPLKEWAGASDTVAHSFTALDAAFTQAFGQSLKQLPSDTSNYLKDASMEPTVLSGGLFAQEAPDLSTIGLDLRSVMAAAAINSLWAADNVFLVLLDDSVWGGNAGDACKVVPDYTVCIDGVAYILFRWKLFVADKERPAGAKRRFALLEDQWYVWGAGNAGKVNGKQNTDHLKDYGLNLRDVVVSIKNTWDTSGQQFPFTGQLQAVQNAVQNDPLKLNPRDLLSFSLPVCNLHSILGDGKKMSTDVSHLDIDISRLALYTACLCSLDPHWPKNDYPFTVGQASPECSLANASE